MGEGRRKKRIRRGSKILHPRLEFQMPASGQLEARRLYDPIIVFQVNRRAPALKHLLPPRVCIIKKLPLEAESGHKLWPLIRNADGSTPVALDARPGSLLELRMSAVPFLPLTRSLMDTAHLAS